MECDENDGSMIVCTEHELESEQQTKKQGRDTTGRLPKETLEPPKESEGLCCVSEELECILSSRMRDQEPHQDLHAHLGLLHRYHLDYALCAFKCCE